MSKGFASNYRIVLLASLVFASFVCVGARLVSLHVTDRAALLAFVEKARREIIPDYARRGDILDARGGLLATSRSLVVLGADPQSIRPEDARKWPELARLVGMPCARLEAILTTKFRLPGDPAAAPTSPAKDAELGANAAGGAPTAGAETSPQASGTDRREFKFDLGPAPGPRAAADNDTELGEADPQGRRPIQWVKLSDTVSESTYAQIQALGIRGIYGNRIYRRVYPERELAAHVVGYVNLQGDAVAGIERYADFYLRGQNGWVESEKDGRRIELAQFRTREVPASDGYSVKLSIDSTVQHIAEDELAEIDKKFSPLKATIIVSDPRTGFILALANTPTFDPNAYNTLGKSEVYRMTDTALADIYEPGSVFKIVAASGALNDGLVTPATTFDCAIDKITYNGRERSLPREAEGDHFDHPLPVADIIAKSSNRGAAQLAMRLGDRRFYYYVQAFGFGQQTGFPSVGDESRGILEPPERWDALTITRMPMGQSIGATPLQMHQAMSVIASGGVLLRPQVIREITNASGEIVYRFDRVEERRVLSERTARTMARLLERVASADGTAPEAAIPGYEVAGKTGTAQKAEPVLLASGRTVVRYADRQHVASFVGFFPASDPQIMISVIVDDADEHRLGGTAFGRIVAAPFFRHIGEQLISYRDIKAPLLGDGRRTLALGGDKR